MTLAELQELVKEYDREHEQMIDFDKFKKKYELELQKQCAALGMPLGNFPPGTDKMVMYDKDGRMVAVEAEIKPLMKFELGIMDDDYITAVKMTIDKTLRAKKSTLVYKTLFLEHHEYSDSVRVLFQGNANNLNFEDESEKIYDGPVTPDEWTAKDAVAKDEGAEKAYEQYYVSDVTIGTSKMDAEKTLDMMSKIYDSIKKRDSL